MWRSVPQMPAVWTRIRTSLMPIGGDGTSNSERPGPACVLTSAFTALVCARRGRSAGIPRVIGPVDDRVLDRADAFDLAADAVTGLEEHRRVAEDAHARRRTGCEKIPRLERDDAAHVLDGGRNVPQHVGGRPVLHQRLPAGVRARAADPPAPQTEVTGIRD